MNKDEPLSFFIPLYRLKELFRQGWIGKVPSSEIESVADHSFGVAFLCLVFVQIENKLRLKKNPTSSLLNKSNILEKSLFHDLPESQYMDFDRTVNELLPLEYQNLKDKLDSEGESTIVQNFDQLLKDIFSIIDTPILPQMNSKNTEEDEFIKLIDNLELYFQTCHYLNKNFISKKEANPFIEGSLAKIRNLSDKFLFIDYLFKFNS